MVRVAKLRPEDTAATILVGHNNTVMALAGDGATRWRLELSGHVHTASVSSAMPWLALGTRDGQVFVVDAVKGEMSGGVTGQVSLREVARIGDPPLLLVATRDSLNAIRIDAK
jgi:hypothetical protein